MKKQREGPKTECIDSCTGCMWHKFKEVWNWLDLQHYHYCKHPRVYYETSGLEADTQRHIGSTRATPRWCPALNEPCGATD